jgi:hypothetical protein
MTIFGSMGLRGYGGTLFQVRDPLHVFLRIPQKTRLAGSGRAIDGKHCVFGRFALFPGFLVLLKALGEIFWHSALETTFLRKTETFLRD